jgi:nitric oxide reductase NorE protein
MLTETPAQGRRLPGEAGLWVLIFGDLFVFSLFFLTFLYYRDSERGVFVASQFTLNREFGLTNTFLLLTSSLFVAAAVRRVREIKRGAGPLFISAMVCGFGFVIIKAFEYGAKFNAGIGLTTNDFFMLYFAFTGIHLIHVLAGLVVLGLLASLSEKPGAGTARLVWIECGAIFWHLVDLLWVVLFSLFYLLR